MTSRKPFIVLVLLLAFTLLSGCSLLDEVNQTADYATSATQYMNEVNAFGEQLKTTAAQTVLTPDGREQLVADLSRMKESALAFIGIDPPAIAEEFHSQVTGYNEALTAEIDRLTEQLQADAGLQAITDSGLLQTAASIASLSAALEQLPL